MPKLQNIFATPIAEFDWDRDPNILSVLETRLLQDDTSYEKICTFESIEFITWVLEKAKLYAWSVGRRHGYISCPDIWHRTMTNPANFVPPHIHPSVWAVGTFYFNAGMGDIVLLDPRGYINDWEWKSVKDLDGIDHYSCPDYYHTPKENTCLFFPGYLKHLVLPASNSEKRQRTAISWNIHTHDERFIEVFNPPAYAYTSLEN